jgi:hypothetical protein
LTPNTSSSDIKLPSIKSFITKSPNQPKIVPTIEVKTYNLKNGWQMPVPIKLVDPLNQTDTSQGPDVALKIEQLASNLQLPQ